MEIIQQLLNGLALGSVYALIAIGYTMVYGIIKLINFAHGDIYMAGAYFGYVAVARLNLGFIPALILAMTLSALLGIIIEKVAYKRLRNSPRITLLITAIGMSLLLENGFRLIFGPNPKPFPELLKTKIFHLGSLRINNIQLIIFAVSIVLVIILEYIVFKTKTGKAMRASSYDIEAAKLMGINVDKIISLTFAIGSALAGAGGILVGIAYPRIEPYMGIMPGLKAFVAAVLGGIGVLPGAMLGGLVMGVAETFTKAFISTKLSDAIIFSILIVVLIVKPDGLLGKQIKEKV
ncbi:branched-chain amino acid ABC transporter permease [Ilyobacter polytropus]|uniref:Amino acid/amide ABC transporter membrane protein 1, HAAT family n=1 Tax=Ilyobacter polytropus (strain ATCC 51220 / DSM 2926 / LMG 16218 / CuHBu1) TaxID=572544 RepID=E3HB52_ILYPC|nr:branched-chain amino acid ABC transporter permease [Ilyobacter polytropus]ADO82203.1 amino acid/amide ABC transporter membrane protein 1, HAAT family [Ilyobacter polytropus DSM 2926]